MNDNGIQLSEPFRVEAPGAAPASPLVKNPVLFVHRLLRGRYRYAVPLSLLLAAGMGVAGFSAMPPEYESSGIVLITPKIDTMIYDTPESRVPPYFETYVASQAALLSGRRVLDKAVASDSMRKIGWPVGDEGVMLLQKSLVVGSGKKTTTIPVSVDHAKPQWAQVAVNAVLDAYEEIYGFNGRMTVTAAEKQIDDLRKSLTDELDSYRKRIATSAEKYGTDDLGRIREGQMQQKLQLDQTIGELEFQIGTLEAKVQDAVDKGNDPGATNGQSVEVMALTDQALDALLRQQSAMKQQIATLSQNLGPEHRQIKELTRQLAAVNGQIADRMDVLQKRPSLNNPALGTANLETLKATRTRYLQLVDKINKNLSEMTNAQLNIDQLKEKAADLRARLDQVEQRLNQMNVEKDALAEGRVSVPQRGELPVEPKTDRRLPLAVAGAGFGAGVGLGVFALIGFLGGTYRYIDELEGEDQPARLLGALPELSSRDPEHDAQAALSVHQLRNLLRLRAGRRADERGIVYTITSPSQGDGKTSLALALGMSFAVSGCRTILVDADLVGRGLSRRLGYNGVPGLCDVIATGSVNGEVVQTSFRNLWALPAGQREQIRPEHLSEVSLQALVEQLRGLADAIIVDTGPLMGSLEANLLSSLSDRVVLTISRGQRQRLLKASLQRLRSLGAVCAGVVLNRAEREDVERSTSSLSVSHQSIPAEPDPTPVVRGAAPSGERHTVVRAILGDLDRPAEGRKAS